MAKTIQERWEVYAKKAGFLDDKDMVLPGQHERAATSFYTWEACEKELAAAKAEPAEDAARFAWYFGPTDKLGFVTTWMEGCRKGWNLDQWRAAVDAALSQSAAAAKGAK